MIPVQRRRAPRGFNAKVFRPGRAWLSNNKLPSRGAVPKGPDGKSVSLEPFWRACLEDLHARYGGVCAYVSVYIDPLTGARSVDHFIAKSSAIEHAYRWSNFRLACLKMNACKGTFDDVLDPFTMRNETFHLNLLAGSIAPNPSLPRVQKEKARAAICRLGLDEPDCRRARVGYFQDYCTREIDERHLKKRCPFVWYEAHRQGLL